MRLPSRYRRPAALFRGGKDISSGFPGVGGGGGEISQICPTITPTLGVEKISNGEFTTNTDDWTANSATLARVDSASDPGTASGGADNYCLKLTDAGVGASARSANLGNLQHQWVTIGGKAYGPSANASALVAILVAGSTLGGLDYFSRQIPSEDQWRSLTGSFLVTGTSLYITLSCAGGDNDLAYYDAVTVKPITGTTVSLGQLTHQAGTYTCHPTAADFTQAGIDILVKDSLNFVRVIVDRNGTDQARMYNCVNGVFAAVANAAGNITYGDGKTLAAYVQADGTVKLYYDGAQVGSDGSLTLANYGKGVSGFSAYSGNAVGLVTTSEATIP